MGWTQQVLAEIDLGEGIDNVQANGIDPFLDFRLTFDP